MDYRNGSFYYKGKPLGDLASYLEFIPPQIEYVLDSPTVADSLLEEADNYFNLAIDTQDLWALATAMITTYGWQVANGAPLLIHRSELAKIHHKRGPLYLWRVPK